MGADGAGRGDRFRKDAGMGNASLLTVRLGVKAHSGHPRQPRLLTYLLASAWPNMGDTAAAS